VNVDSEAESEEAELEVGVDDKEGGVAAARVYERMGRRNIKTLILQTIAIEEGELEMGKKVAGSCWRYSTWMIT
jgi:hypothetical protein